MNIQHQASIIARQLTGELPTREGKHATLQEALQVIGRLSMSEAQTLLREINAYGKRCERTDALINELANRISK